MTEAQLKDRYIEGFSGTGSDTVHVFIVTLEDSPGVPFSDLTGATASFKAKKSYSSTVDILDLDQNDGILIDDSLGTLTISITKDHFAVSGTFIYTRDEQDFVYDLDLIDNTGRTWRLYKGDLNVGGDI